MRDIIHDPNNSKNITEIESSEGWKTKCIVQGVNGKIRVTVNSISELIEKIERIRNQS